MIRESMIERYLVYGYAANATSLLMLQQLGGWRTRTMVNCYAHLAGGQLSIQAANSQILPQAGKPSAIKKAPHSRKALIVL